MARLFGHDPQAKDCPVEGFRRLEVIDVDGGFDNGLDLHDGLRPGWSFRPRSSRRSSSTVSPDAPLHGHHSIRYYNSSRIFVRASSLVGAVTSTWPVDDPVCRASHLPLARRETVQVSFMGVNPGCQVDSAAIARSYQPLSAAKGCRWQNAFSLVRYGTGSTRR